MRSRLAVAALLSALTVASATAADHAPPPDAPRPAAEWSFGAGVQTNLLGVSAPTSSILSLLPSLGGSTSVLDPRGPMVTTSLERRLSDRSWLALGVSGAVARQRADVPPGAYGFARDDERALYVSAGLRRVVTRRGAPIEVSGLVYAEGGIVDAERNLVTPISTTRQDVTGWVAGAGLGLALERELTEALSLRVASPLVAARYGHEHVRQEGQPTSNASTVGMFAVLEPRLELRLAF